MGAKRKRHPGGLRQGKSQKRIAMIDPQNASGGWSSQPEEKIEEEEGKKNLITSIF